MHISTVPLQKFASEKWLGCGPLKDPLANEATEQTAPTASWDVGEVQPPPTHGTFYTPSHPNPRPPPPLANFHLNISTDANKKHLGGELAAHSEWIQKKMEEEEEEGVAMAASDWH